MKYQLIVSDFDGTFRHRDNTVGQKTVSAVQEYIRQGGKFAICTGRMPTSIRPVLQRLQLDGLYVAYQGSIVGEVQSENFLRESGFTKEQALRICALMQGMGMRIHLYDRENCYVNYSDEYLKVYEEICHIQAVYVEDLYAFILNSSQKFFKLLAMVRREERNQVRDTLRQKLGEDEFYISCSASTLVEVTSVNDTKAAAVEFLCNYYHVDKSAVLAFGDNQNDAPLLQAAGHGVAVANADEFLKSVADEVFDKTCDEDAVGDYILRFVL